MDGDQKIIEAFSKSLPDYLRDVETTSGRLFYSIAWHQIAEHLAMNKELSILDIGCGFGLTSIWLSEQGHLVTGIDMTPDMIRVAEQKAREKNQSITFVQGQIERIDEIFKDTTFDWIICHNVLGYVDQPMEALAKMKSLLSPGGHLSIIAHNPAAKVLKKAIVDMDLKNAKKMMTEEKEFNPLIQAYVHQYFAAAYLNWFEELSLDLIECYGIRCVFDYMNENKQIDPQNDLQDYLALELELGKTKPYLDIAFFSHYLVKKP